MVALFNGSFLVRILGRFQPVRNSATTTKSSFCVHRCARFVFSMCRIRDEEALSATPVFERWRRSLSGLRLVMRILQHSIAPVTGVVIVRVHVRPSSFHGRRLLRPVSCAPILHAQHSWLFQQTRSPSLRPSRTATGGAKEGATTTAQGCGEPETKWRGHSVASSLAACHLPEGWRRWTPHGWSLLKNEHRPSTDVPRGTSCASVPPAASVVGSSPFAWSEQQAPSVSRRRSAASALRT